MALKRVAVLTTGRQDYGILRSLCQDLQGAPDFELFLIVGGTHLSSSFGYTIREIEADGLPIAEKLDTMPSDDSREAAARAAGRMTELMAQVLERRRPELLILVGDRYETLAAALAATLTNVPLTHLHGGEETEGAIDNSLRHAITKLSHLHYASNELHARRIVQMGEEPKRVLVVGAPGLDVVRREPLLTRAELEEELSVNLKPPVLVVTYHPTTLAEFSAREEVAVLLESLSDFAGSVIFTLPNADPGNVIIREAILKFVETHLYAHAFESLGSKRYLSLLKHADAMLGNSSSGLIETPLFELPTLNIGDRQEGRLRGKNVIDVALREEEIKQTLKEVLDSAFRQLLSGMESPYGDGQASKRIIESLRETDLGSLLLRKRFNMPVNTEPCVEMMS